jgi:hypothetical protein
LARMRAVSRHRRSDNPRDELYTAPIGDWVARRKALAARLREQGRSDEAKALSRLAKPKATVWAINRVARTSPKTIKRLLDAFDALKAAQLRAPAKMNAAAADFREATEAVVHDAIDAMKESGLGTTLETHRRIANTLRGAAATARGALAEGRLEDEVAPGGFDLFAGTMPRGQRPRLRAMKEKPAAAPAAPARDDLVRRRATQLEEEAREHERAAQSAQAALLEARERLRELEGTARTAGRTAAKSRTVAERARRKAEKRPRR